MWISLRSKRGLRVRPLRSCESLERAGILFYQLWHLIECFQQGNHEIWLTYITSNIRNSFSLMFDNSYLGTAPEASYHRPSTWDNRWGERGKGYIVGKSWSWNYTIHYRMEIHRWKKLGYLIQYWNWQRSVSCQLGRASWDINTTSGHFLLIYLLQLITGGVIMVCLHQAHLWLLFKVVGMLIWKLYAFWKRSSLLLVC